MKAWEQEKRTSDSVRSSTLPGPVVKERVENQRVHGTESAGRKTTQGAGRLSEAPHSLTN